MSDFKRIKCYEDKHAELEIKNLEEKLKGKKLENNYIRELISKQNGKISVKSEYYNGRLLKEIGAL